MDVKSMVRKQRRIHSCHVKFSVKQTDKERITDNYEFCARALYVNHQLVYEETEYYHISI